MYRVEMMPKQPMIDNWIAAGREPIPDNRTFVFEEVDDFDIDEGVISVRRGNDVYGYNTADLHRFKVTKLEDK